MRATKAMTIIALLAVLVPTVAAGKTLPAERAPRHMPDQDPAWSATAVEHRGRVGLQIEVICPAGGSLSAVWGNNPYTDDSSICSAAVHAGLLRPASGGHVLIEIQAGRKAFRGNYRNGVTSYDYGAWESSFAFPQAARNLKGQPEPPPDPEATTWWTSATELRGKLGERFEFHCPPNGSPRSVWGNGPYTDDSSICTAAVHAKVISLTEGGRVWIEIQTGAALYPACVRNGIRANRWGSYPGGFIVVHGAGPCKQPVEWVDGQPLVDWTTTASLLPGGPGDSHRLVCPAGGPPGAVWGSGPYTDDSSICTAAVHAGAIHPKKGGSVYIQIRPGQPAYQDSLQNGIQTLAWREWARSFLVLPAER